MSDPCIASSPRIALSVTGTPRALTADIVPSPHPGNVIQNRGDGLYAPGIQWVTSGVFPTTPDDGMLVAMPATDGVTWVFRYNAASTNVHEWEFVGGGDWFVNIDTAGTIASPSGANNWVTLASTGGVGPDIIVPLDAVWQLRFGAAINAALDNNKTNGGVAEVGVSVGGLDPNDNHVARSGNENVSSVMREIQISAPNGTRFRLMYRDGANSGNTTGFSHRWISLRPVRAG